MRTIRTLFALLVLLVAAGSARAETARITILHTTDLHGSLTDFDYYEDAPADRGLVRIATMVQKARDEGTPTLLLDAGDCIQGGPVSSVHYDDPDGRPDPMMAAMSRIGYDAMAVGNHEFDRGLNVIARARADASFPWLAANILRADGTPAFQPSIVREAGPVRVGIIGLCTPAVPSWVDEENRKGLRFVSPVDAAHAEASRLRADEGCDVVVVLAHTGLERDTTASLPSDGDTPDENWGHRLMRDVPGVDVVILGHTHVIVDSLRTGPVLASQAGKWAEALGRVDLTLTREGNARWRIATQRALVEPVTHAVAADSALAAFADPYHRAARAAFQRPVARATTDIASPGGRLADGPLWELVHRAQMDASGAQVSLAALFTPEARISAGTIRYRHLAKLYPYDNTLAVIELTGAELKETLEHAARYFATYRFEHDARMTSGTMPGFNFDAAEGVSYEVDITQPAGNRIAKLRYRDKPLDPGKKLRVAVNNYRLNGGGGFDAVARAKVVWRSDRSVREILVDYVRSMKTLDGSYKRNWRVLPDYAGTPERPLIDLLVRQGLAPREEILRLGAETLAQRGDLAYWLGRAFNLRSGRRSGAFRDLPNALEPWVDGLLNAKVLGETASLDAFEPFAPVTVWITLDWCERAARGAGYALGESFGDPSFRRGLLSGVSFDAERARAAASDSHITRAQLLGMIANLRYPSLRVLSTTDFHGAVEPGTDRSTGRPLGGSVALAAHIERLRSANPEGTVLLDGGDCFQGTMVSNLQYGRPVVEQMNRLRYDAFAIGNHEFDWSADTLQNRVREMRFAALAANMLERRDDRAPAWVRSDTMFARRGVHVGVLGLAYRNTPTVTLAKHVAPYRFEDDSLTAARVAPRLKREGAEVILGVGHVPAESNRERKAREGDLVRLARGIRTVDAWFGGHSHNFVEDDVDGTPVLIPGSHGRAVAVCDIVVDPLQDRVVERRYWLDMAYADDIQPDSAWVSLAARWVGDVAPIAETVVGRNARDLDRAGPEAGIGNLLADVMRLATGADIGMQNSGGMRADLAGGEVTRGEVYAVMPFDNTIVTVEITGAEVKRALDEAMRRGRVTQVSGIRYTYDPDRPELERVISVTDANGTPLDPRKRYVVACNNFMATGGDDYASLASGANMDDTKLLIRDAMEDHIRAASANGGALDVKRDGRIRRVEAGVPAGSR